MSWAANFSLMVAGARGTGKSSFVNCLFGNELLVENCDTANREFLDINHFELTENGFTLNLQIIETVNYGISLTRGSNRIHYVLLWMRNLRLSFIKVGSQERKFN